MAGRKLNVVISQAPGKNPVKRQLEEEIATRLILGGIAEVSIVPHVSDLTADHTGILWLKSMRGDLVVLSWLFPRATRWVLDRNGVKGKDGLSRLNKMDDDEDGDDDETREKDPSTEEPAASRGIGSVDVPNRLIYAIDLRNDGNPETYVSEIKRIAELVATPLIQLSGLGLAPGVTLPIKPANTLPSWNAPRASDHVEKPASANGSNGTHAPAGSDSAGRMADSGERHLAQVDATIGIPDLPIAGPTVIGGDDIRRRWYPVIDYSRCTNCMECIDFCLFGVYGVDNIDRILVEEQDNCKKGCPACSRVCPVNAIIFPEHKTASIAGAEGAKVEDFKIDLSKLFGAPSALEMAVLERDTELVADGREAVGAAIGLPKRHSGIDEKPRDELDDLMDGLDSLEL